MWSATDTTLLPHIHILTQFRLCPLPSSTIDNQILTTANRVRDTSLDVEFSSEAIEVEFESDAEDSEDEEDEYEADGYPIEA